MASYTGNGNTAGNTVTPARAQSTMGVDNPRCPLCKEHFIGSAEFEVHKTTSAHRVKWLLHWYNMQKVQLAGNKNGVEVYPQGEVDYQYDAEEGKVSVTVQPGDRKTFDLVVRNGLDCAPVILRQVDSLHSSNVISISDQYEVTKNAKFVRILKGIEYAIQCHVKGDSVGVENLPIAFQLKSERDDSVFFIVRTVELVVVDSIARDAAPQTCYEKSKTKYYSMHDVGTYERGVPLSSEGPLIRYKIPLGQYYYKAGLKHMVYKDFNPSKVGEHFVEDAKKLRNMMKEGLTFKNYQMWFQTMLWAEEIQMERDIQFYSIKESRLKMVPSAVYVKARCVELQVPGLAEKRPSVLKGDSVFITLAGKKNPVYQGIVHQVNEKSVYLALNESFMRNFIDNLRVSVEFTFNRFPLRVSHRALQLAKELSLSHLIFPTAPSSNSSAVAIKPFNRKIESNPEQLEAIENIIGGTSKPAPYIIFGPPGTGKTVTVVEAIKQVYKLHQASVVLAAAPSNSAVDLIARRLMEHIPERHMLRLHAPSRSVFTIPTELLPISNVKNNSIYIPEDGEYLKYRVLICTFVTAARIASVSLPPGSVTHVFLDECGHAMEPESMVALAGIVEADSQVVLAGDPYQLGPVIRNRQCYSGGHHFKPNGLDKSYLERLMEEKIYQPNGRGVFNRRVVTKLLNNYRSHSYILKESNGLFYNNELKALADPVLVNSLCNWEYLPKRNFPLVFHGVRGKDEREGNSPSYFNPIEVSHVVTYTRNLLESRNPKIAAKDIGIITPYRRQVEKIRDQFRKNKLPKDIKVGSPEEFQGDERRVIIISCVRASSDQLAEDEFFKLGFLRNPKRFNVAVTRAKALLIVIGCPDILQLDPHWNKLLTYIHKNGGYTGVSLMANTLDLDDILERFSRLNLRPLLVEEVGAREIAEAPEWRVEG